jgi:hypothetical protein
MVEDVEDSMAVVSAAQITTAALVLVAVERVGVSGRWSRASRTLVGLLLVLAVGLPLGSRARELEGV